jgi:dihydroxyacetone kinase-like predicted kinase
MHLTEGQQIHLVYDQTALVVRHAITAGLRSMSEARINGAPGNSGVVLRLEW